MSGVMELPPQYSIRRFPFMRVLGEWWPATENYVRCPPALYVTDSAGKRFTFGFDYDEREWRTGKWEYDILYDGHQTGEWARIIELRAGKVSIWGADGWRRWNGRCFV